MKCERCHKTVIPIRLFKVLDHTLCDGCYSAVTIDLHGTIRNDLTVDNYRWSDPSETMRRPNMRLQ